MTATAWATIRRAFSEVVDLPPAERPAALDRLAAGDAHVRAEVESLLAAHDAESSADGPLPMTLGTAAAAIDHQPGEMLGRYRLVERVGEGGFGTVFIAEQTEPFRRRVALKVLKLGMDTAAVVGRFEAERQALALMDHPHIARVFDAGATPTGRPYFVMELVEGRPIHEFCRREGLSIRSRIELMVLVCRAVQHAHQKGVIHRDLKPSNVLVTTGDGRPAPKVIDFGIAKAVRGHLTDRTLNTEAAQFVGTPEYMSPEQAGGAIDLDTRSDVYSLGVMLYQLLTGSTPLDPQRLRALPVDEARRLIREEDPPRPSTRVSTVAARSTGAAPAATFDPPAQARQLRGELDWIVMKAVEKSPGHRYDSPERLAADLEHYLAGEPIAAGPPTVTYRLRKFVARRRGLVAAAGVAVLAAALGVAGLAAGLVQASRERDAAFESRARADREARKYQAADDFMKHVLSNARPSGETGRPVTVGELLDEAAIRLDTGSLKDDPVVQATVRLSLAQSYRTLGQLDKARGCAQRALELAEGEALGRNATAAEAMVELALIANDVGDQTLAIDLAQRAHDLLRDLGETRTWAYFNALQCQGSVRVNRGDREAGEAYLREAIEVASAMFGASSAQAAQARAFLAARAHSRAGSEEELRGIVEAYRTALGPNHPSVVQALLALGIHLHMTRRYDEAEQVYGEALQLAEQTLGPDHYTTFVALDFHGWIADSKGDFDVAIERRRRVVELARRYFGPSSVRVGTCLNSLGLAAQRKGDMQLALEAFQEAVDVQRTAKHTESMDYYLGLGNLAMAHLDLGDCSSAERAAREVLEAPESVRARITGMLGRATLLLGECELLRREFTAAEPLMLEGFALIDKGRTTSNRAPALFLAAASVARLYTEWHAADPDPQREASAAEWAARREEWRAKVDWNSPGMSRFKDR